MFKPNIAPLLLALALALVVPGSADAADVYPSRSIRIIVPFPAGGSSDILTRVVAQEMSETLGQPIVIDNRTGAGGNIGADAAAKSAPDGYTLLSGSSSLTLANSLFSQLTYDPMGFASVTLLAQAAMLVTVNPAFPVTSLPGLVELAKQKPGEISYASAGYGSMNHLAVELFKVRAGIQLTHVPYRGNPLAAIDVISGQVPVFFDYVSTGLPYVRDGKLRALATTSSKRLQSMPDLPTVSESGLPGYEASLWFALFAPAGTPKDIVNKLNQAALKALAKPNVRERYNAMGLEIIAEGPDKLSELMKTDQARWRTAVEHAGMKQN